MSSSSDKVEQLEALLNFIENAPENQEIIDMDCNDHCEDLAIIAERVANGAELDDVLPELNEHMKYWGDCREEFIALVSVIKAELMDDMPDIPEFQE